MCAVTAMTLIPKQQSQSADAQQDYLESSGIYRAEVVNGIVYSVSRSGTFSLIIIDIILEFPPKSYTAVYNSTKGFRR